MNYRQLYFIEGKLLGEAPRGQIMRHAVFMEPSSDLYICPHCGDTWARLPCLRADGTSTSWQSFHRPCRKCLGRQQFLSEWPGSVWRSWDAEFLAALPPPVLQWELLRHIESWDRFPEGYQ